MFQLSYYNYQQREKTVAERLEPTLEVARRERDTYARSGTSIYSLSLMPIDRVSHLIAFIAKYYGMALNVAIGLQVVIGAITTGVAAATTGRSVSNHCILVFPHI
jgi:SMODS and SLOG-associating 2TM effector domain